MPGYARTPFLSAMSIFKEQPIVAACIFTTTVQSLPDGLNTVLTFAGAVNETPLQTAAWQSVWDSGTPGRFRITIPGWYLVGGGVVLDGMTGLSNLYLYHNTSVATGTGMHAVGEAPRHSFAILRPALVGEYFECAVYQNAGIAVNTNVMFGAPYFWILKVN